ncbi:hypothetical protein ACLIBH_10905 [Virgibacillus sp. W0430]|uniref:hypothetical protein n=1 Tax=Virgibacillus sp. W0430 TaxID=3391580 RepID=UPI003F46AAF8
MDGGEYGVQQVERLKEAADKNSNQKIDRTIHTLKEGDVIDGLEVIELPGHAEDQIALYDEKNCWLFSGDHILDHLASNALIEPDINGEMIQSLIHYEASLNKLRAYSVAVVFPGHGEMIQDVQALITQRLTRIQNKSEKIKALINDFQRTAAHIARTLYKNRFETLFPLVMSEIIGHLNRLESLGEITKEKLDGKWVYRSK